MQPRPRLHRLPPSFRAPPMRRSNPRMRAASREGRRGRARPGEISSRGRREGRRRSCPRRRERRRAAAEAREAAAAEAARDKAKEAIPGEAREAAASRRWRRPPRCRPTRRSAQATPQPPFATCSRPKARTPPRKRRDAPTPCRTRPRQRPPPTMPRTPRPTAQRGEGPGRRRGASLGQGYGWLSGRERRQSRARAMQAAAASQPKSETLTPITAADIAAFAHILGESEAAKKLFCRGPIPSASRPHPRPRRRSARRPECAWPRNPQRLRGR